MGVNWIEIGATVLSGLITSLVFSYFQSDRLQVLIDRTTARTYVWCTDHLILSVFLPALAVTLAVPAGSGHLEPLPVAACFAGWATVLLWVSVVHRRRASRVVSFNAAAPAAGAVQLQDWPDGSTLVGEYESQQVIRIAGSDPDRHYIYLRLAEAAARDFRRSTFIIFALEVGDAHAPTVRPERLHFGVQFDRSEEVAFKTSYSQGVLGSAPWLMSLSSAPGAAFRRRQQGVADLRVWVRRGLDLQLRSVHVIALTR